MHDMLLLQLLMLLQQAIGAHTFSTLNVPSTSL
jgi:hypothetical protein